MKTVFVSYSHKDEPWKDQLLPHLRALEQAGVEMKVWEDRQIDAGAQWYPEIQSAMADSVVAVLLISANYLASSFCIKEEVPYLLERQEKHGMLLIPVLIRPCPWKSHRWLSARQMLPRDGKCVAIDFSGDHADIIFEQVAAQVCDFLLSKVGPMASLSVPRPIVELRKVRANIPFPPSEPPVHKSQWPQLTSQFIDLSHLPETGAMLFGREEELDLLDKTWALDGQAGAIRVMAFKAQGGVGKSALINCWLAEMKRDNFRGATRVFGWSFYSQGVHEQGAASADTFIAAALRFFGDEAMANSSASSWDKGARLAHLVGAERALLVLDGMEPLQSGQWVDRGNLRDPGLESLLRGLASQSAGLCIITTRESLAELGKKSGIVERDLEQITPQAARALLRASHIVGTDKELEQLAESFGPHALAISLLAVYLHEQPGHSIAPAKELEKLSEKEPVDRVLAGFEKMLADSAELEAVRLLGFFDRPADEGCLRALREKPAISGLTDLLADMGDANWPRVLARLDKFHLLHARHGESGKRYLDSHPLIREYFAKHLHEQNPDAWQAGHRRLYEHLCSNTQEGNQPTLEDLQPLYQAVAHGCQAGLHKETHDKVWFTRIRRQNEYYSVRKLGAFGSDLGAVACFFEHPWNRASRALTENDQSVLMNAAASWLQALGRLSEALEPMRVSGELDVKVKEWKGAAASYSNLSVLELTLGEVAGAVGDAEQSVTYADSSGDAWHRMSKRTTHADALHQAGRRAEAETRFREAEQMQAEDQTVYPQLYSILGFQYCDLLLAPTERAAWQAMIPHLEPLQEGEEVIEVCDAVSRRAAQTLKWVEAAQLDILSIGLDHLTLGRAALYEAFLTKSDVQNAKLEIDQAVIILRRAGKMDVLPRGLLTRAWLRFLDGVKTGPESAQADLNEAWEIAERGPMKLFMADIHLYRARLFFREEKYPWESPQTDLAAARELIEKCGYWRRKEELEDAERVILGSEGEKEDTGGVCS